MSLKGYVLVSTGVSHLATIKFGKWDDLLALL
jgi:hypothetical protein